MATLAAAALLVAAAVRGINPVDVGPILAAPPVEYRYDMEFRSTPFSSDSVRVTPDNCLESVAVNGVAVPKPARHDQWCFPHPVTLHLGPYARPGWNTVRLQLSDRRHRPVRAAVTGTLSPAAVLAMTGCVGLAVAAAAAALRTARPGRFPRFDIGIGRAVATGFVPGLGLAAVWATLANSLPSAFPPDHVLPTLVAVAVSAALLLRAVRGADGRPIGLVRSYAAAALSLAAVAYASLRLVERGGSDPETQGIAAAGVVAGFFAAVPARRFAARLRHYPRAVAVAAVAASAPQAYWLLNHPAWTHLAGPTAAAVRGVLLLCGVSTTTFGREGTDPVGNPERHAVVASPRFAVEIGSWCSGLEGVHLFVFLTACFVLLDWGLFSKARHLWVPFAAAVALALAANVLRVAGLFLYGVWVAGRHHQYTHDATIAAFHSNAGWVAYGVAFALFVPFVYRWAARRA